MQKQLPVIPEHDIVAQPEKLIHHLATQPGQQGVPSSRAWRKQSRWGFLVMEPGYRASYKEEYSACYDA